MGTFHQFLTVPGDPYKDMKTSSQMLPAYQKRYWNEVARFYSLQ